MSVIKIVNGDYKNSDAVLNLLNYITDYCKSEGLVYGYNVIPEFAAQMFMSVKYLYNKTDGRQAIHFILSFSHDEVMTPEILFELSKRIAWYFYGYQVVFAVHTSQSCLHTHFMVNTVSFIDGSRLECNKKFKDELYKYCTNIPIIGLQGYVTNNRNYG